MFKSCVVIFMLLILLIFSAFADSGNEYWTLKDDLYYHCYAQCGNTEGKVPISDEAAEAFDKYPCPICMSIDGDAQGLEAVTRGGTIVLRFSDEYLYSFDVEGVFGFSMSDVSYGQDAWDALNLQLHGERLARFMSDYLANGSAEGICREPDILCTNGELLMNERRIGSSWYITVRPEAKFETEWEMYWRVNEYDISLSAETDNANVEGADTHMDMFSSTFARQTIEDYLSVDLHSLDGDSAGFHKDYDDIELQIFDNSMANIGLIYEENADENLLENVGVCIGGKNMFSVSGYMNGSRGVYVFVLTDAEFNAIANEGATVSLERESLSENADYMDSEYAAVRYGSADTGIIDRNGDFVVEPIYAFISRPTPDSFRITDQRPFFATTQSGDLIIFNGDTLETIAEIKKSENSRYLSAEYMNPAVFKVRVQDVMNIYSLKDGSKLYSVPFGSDGNYIDNITDIDGYFRVLADGEPNRLVMKKGYLLDSECYLIDIESFERASESFNCITPLIWKDGKGVFLVENHNCAELKSSFGGETASCFEYGCVYDGSAFDETWHCGLIDEKGAIIAPVIYTSIEVLSENEIRLGAQDGSFKTVELFA